MIIFCKAVVFLCGVFFIFHLIGTVKMGPEEFHVWLGEKILDAWRGVRRLLGL